MIKGRFYEKENWINNSAISLGWIIYHIQDKSEAPDDKNKLEVKPEPAPSIKGKYPAYYSGQAYNEVMEYVLFKVKNYDFEVDLKDAKKK